MTKMIDRCSKNCLVAAVIAFGNSASAGDPTATFRSDLLRYVEDNLPVQNRNQNQFEAQCYEQMVLHARRTPIELLERHSNRHVNFAHLFGDDRARYRGTLVHIEGQLRMLRQFAPPETLEGLDDGLTALYEAWIFDAEFGNNPDVIVFSELPANIQPGESLNRRVETDAYFFKRYRYGAKDGTRDAPLLIARTIRTVAEPAAVSSTSALAGVATLIAAFVAIAAAVVWWTRRADRRVRRELASVPNEYPLPTPEGR